MTIVSYNCFFITQHVIFTISAFLAFLVPDVPASVQNEIKKERLLAYEAIHQKLAATSPVRQARYEGEDM